MNPFNTDLIRFTLTLTSLVSAVVVYVVLRQAIVRLPILPDQKRRARKTSAYGSILALFVLLLVVWADELREAALVLSAFAVAIALSTKELLMCITGWWLKLAGGHFRVGDRIRIGAYNGDVVDYGLLTITLLEVDPGQERTGGVLTIPNSMLLVEAVVNQTLAFSFQWHSVLIKVPQELDWQKAETALLEAGREIWAEFDAEAEGQAEQLTHRFASQPDAREPEVFLGHGEDGKQTLELRIGLPVRQEYPVEDKILRAYYSKVSIHA